jgi:hypothetical protein
MICTIIMRRNPPHKPALMVRIFAMLPRQAEPRNLLGRSESSLSLPSSAP